MPVIDFPRNGKTNVKDLEKLLQLLGFTVDRKKVDALTYEFASRSLGYHIRLLAPIRKTEAVEYENLQQSPEQPDFAPQYRLMGILWFGERYQEGFAIEVFGEDLGVYMASKATALREAFEHEVAVAHRILRTAVYK